MIEKFERKRRLGRRTFVRASVGRAVASSTLGADRLFDVLVSKLGDASNSLPLVSIDEAARLGETLGMERLYATPNVFRGLLTVRQLRLVSWG